MQFKDFLPLLQFFYISQYTSHIVSSYRNGVKASAVAVLSALSLMVILMTPVYADPVVKPTSAGTLNISFETNPASPVPGDQSMLKITFLNKKDNSTQVHIDYKVSVKQGDNQVFGIQTSHTAEGAVSIPIQFQTAGTYQVIVEVSGIVFQPIPPETASFTVDVGNTPAIPEFGPLAGMIIAISTISVIIISKKTQFHI